VGPLLACVNGGSEGKVGFGPDGGVLGQIRQILVVRIWPGDALQVPRTASLLSNPYQYHRHATPCTHPAPAALTCNPTSTKVSLKLVPWH
jgi:hypothetical protein